MCAAVLCMMTALRVRCCISSTHTERPQATCSSALCIGPVVFCKGTWGSVGCLLMSHVDSALLTTSCGFGGVLLASCVQQCFAQSAVYFGLRPPSLLQTPSSTQTSVVMAMTLYRPLCISQLAKWFGGLEGSCVELVQHPYCCRCSNSLIVTMRPSSGTQQRPCGMGSAGAAPGLFRPCGAVRLALNATRGNTNVRRLCSMISVTSASSHKKTARTSDDCSNE